MMFRYIALSLAVLSGSAQAAPVKAYDEFQLINRFERNLDKDTEFFCSTGLGTDEFCRQDFHTLRVKLIHARSIYARDRWRLKNEVLLLHDELFNLVMNKMDP